ncbi:ARM repeat-containing protein [Ascodesmis nigricans]|uniref:ARM repeat-containing protein n=1 Tax=Ascodesmis nigricans TaxID=341454 RepID=A0A4S2N897_9PEZI|nr:ARM repeat-containing protein [Ascodesmis nigricans]
MDPSIQRSLNDKLYDRRKLGALDLEKTVREAILADRDDRVHAIIDQLCHEYAYAVHQPHARNGGLIGLAAASIALGPGVAKYLEQIVPPVLACFTDQDARVRYYACESMYNIAKVAKGEILPFFNEIFDTLAKLAADSELSVKNGAELLDRLIKDIVAESAATYVSILQTGEYQNSDSRSDEDEDSPTYADQTPFPTAFSLPRFIPLLKERIHVINPFTRMFLVSWITLLDSIPDLELVTYLPEFLDGLIEFLSDQNQDVHVATQQVLEGFLAEIKRIAKLKRGVEEAKKYRSTREAHSRTMSESGSGITDEALKATERLSLGDGEERQDEKDDDSGVDGTWVPGQDVLVDHQKILEILLRFLDNVEEEVQLTALRWVDSFFEIGPEELVPFVPRLLAHVLPAIAHPTDLVRHAASKLNTSLLGLIMSLADDVASAPPYIPQVQRLTPAPKEVPAEGRRDSSSKPGIARDQEPGRRTPTLGPTAAGPTTTPTPEAATPQPSSVDLDYAATVNALTLQFLNEHEQTRVAALEWLLMLHRKAPRKMLTINDGTFPALLQTLSDPSEQVVTRDLQLLSQISHNSEDDYFASFMHSLLSLFSTDRRLLETRGNLIIRHLCVNLNPERIFRTMADILEKDEDVEFASIMVLQLNNNLITAPELVDLRKRLRSLETKDGQALFVSLFRSWCHNAVATFSLCLLAQAYEQASNLLSIIAELEITVTLLIQIDKLVHLLESPVFTYLRLQLLEPEKYPYLYKCLYGLLMLLPQSSAFQTLKNRLNAVSAIGYLHTAPRPPPPSNQSSYSESRGRLKGRGDEIKWMELLEKFKQVQERQRKQQQQQGAAANSFGGGGAGIGGQVKSMGSNMSLGGNNRGETSGQVQGQSRAPTPAGRETPSVPAPPPQGRMGRGGLVGIGRLAGGKRVTGRR